MPEDPGLVQVWELAQVQVWGRVLEPVQVWGLVLERELVLEQLYRHPCRYSKLPLTAPENCRSAP